MSRLAIHGRARGGRALASMLLAVGGLAACGPGQEDPAAAASAVVAQAVPPDKAECRRWTTCVPENPCHTGWVTGCRRNVPICTDIGGWLSNGTSCGTDAVCFMGECEPCAGGQSCPIPDMYGNPDACRAGQIFCDTGQPVCREVGPAPDGTSCGGGGPYVCKGGLCTFCSEGSSCAVPEKPCHQGTVTACATTGGTCVDTGAFQPNGTWCEYYTAVCQDGECAACAQWSACTPQEFCMESGWTDCSSGWPVCIPNTQKPDGTPCDGGVCQGGQCRTPCVPDQPCLPGNACYGGRTVCWDLYNGYCEQRDPLPDGTGCGSDQVCRAGSCTSCGPGSWCQSPDPCYGSGTVSCATGQCSPAGDPYENGWTCGLGGETCQAGICTDDAELRLLVRSASWSFDLTGTSWTRCVLAAGGSRRVTDTFGIGTGTHVVESFATPDCSGDAQTRTEGGRTVTSAGDRYVAWSGGTPPPGAPWSPTLTATAVHTTGENPDGTPVDVKNLYWVNDWYLPRQLFRGDMAHLGADGYPVLLLPDTNPFTQVIPPCVPDQPCTPSNACYTGRTVCWDPYNGSCEQRDPLPDGTSCGVDLVCSYGGCVPCGPTASCQPPDRCHASAALSCATGLCEPQEPYGDGLFCGVGGETCQGGTCTGVPGADPWVRSNFGAVDLAGTTWFDCLADEPVAGKSRLRVETWVAGGVTHQDIVFASSVDCSGPTDPALSFTAVATITLAGDRLVTWGGGWPPAGLPWQPWATAMHVSAPDSPMGPIDFKRVVFVDDAVSPRQLYAGDKDPAFADGYPAQLRGSMPMAEVLACNAGAPCTPGFATCEVFTIDCSTGAPVCTGTGAFLSDGTRCADGHSWCQAGACVPVPTRTVTGTSQLTYWPDAGPAATTDPSPLQSIAAVQFAGGFAYHPGTVNPDGSFVIPDVETGSYQLEARLPWLAYYQSSADTVDLGMDVLGRRDVAWPTGPTPVWFDVTGLVPWTRGDILEFASSNAGVAALPFGAQDSPDVPEGLDQLVGSFDWNGRPLVSGAAKDVAYVFQASTTTAPTGERVTAASGWAALPPDFEIADLAGGTVDVTLGPCTSSGAISADWRRSAFEAYAGMVHPEAKLLNHRIVVSARPHDSPVAPGFRVGELAPYLGLPLLVVQAASPAADTVLDGIAYGRFLPPLWREYRHDRLRYAVDFTAPGATRTARIGVGVGYDVAADRAPYLVAPPFAPPGSLQIGGLDAWSGVAGVGTQPRITWTAPVVSEAAAALFPGATLHYTVTVYELRATGDGGTQALPLFEGITTRTSYNVPGTNMAPGGTYVVAVEAALTVDSLAAPLHFSIERAYSTVVSRAFTP